jgi:hypothetical protein
MAGSLSLVGSTLTHITPVLVQTSKPSGWSDASTSACDTVGAQALITKASRASPAVKRRWIREQDISEV